MDTLSKKPHDTSVDRRGFLKCAALGAAGGAALLADKGPLRRRRGPRPFRRCASDRGSVRLP